MVETKESMYGPTVLRLVIGVLFLVTGFMKLSNPTGIIGMLGNLGFPTAMALGWIVLLAEIGFGAAVLLGTKVKYTVWPLVVILVVAIITVHIPSMATNPMGIVTVLFHLVGIGALVSIFLTGPGALSVGSKH